MWKILVIRLLWYRATPTNMWSHWALATTTVISRGKRISSLIPSKNVHHYQLPHFLLGLSEHFPFLVQCTSTINQALDCSNTIDVASIPKGLLFLEWNKHLGAARAPELKRHLNWNTHTMYYILSVITGALTLWDGPLGYFLCISRWVWPRTLLRICEVCLPQLVELGRA